MRPISRALLAPVCALLILGVAAVVPASVTESPLRVRSGGAASFSALAQDASPWSPGRQDPAPPAVRAVSVIVENLDTGTTLLVKNAGTRRPIASLTKIMTAMVVLQATQPGDIVTGTSLAAKQEPTSLGLKPGQRMRVHALLYALLLHSSNDVAVALAQHVSGSLASFDALMTRRAAALGLTDTRFASPSGLNDKGYSTARDMAAITRWAYRSPTFASIVGRKMYWVRLGKKWVLLRNLNDLLFDYPGAIGAKTGYTKRSRWSLVGVARRGATTLMVVLLGDPDRPFDDGEALLDWAFQRSAASQALRG